MQKCGLPRRIHNVMGAAFDPQASLAALRRQYGEHGGVNASIESSTTFTGTRRCWNTKALKQ